MPGDLDPVTVMVSHTRAATLVSVDGTVRVWVPPLAVSTPVAVTLARVRSDLAPNPRVGEGYVLRVTGGMLAAPARVEWQVGSQVTVPAADLRVATLNAAGVLTPLAGAQGAGNLVAAEVAQAGPLVLVARGTLGGASWAPDLAPGAAGDALLWRGDVSGARAAYQSALARGADAHASLGRAVTSLILLARQPPVSDALLRCGLDQDVVLEGVLGEGGVLAQAAADRAGDGSAVLTDASGETGLLADEVYARRTGADVQVVAAGMGFELRVVLPPETATPGALVDRRGFTGQVALRTGGDTFTWTSRGTGHVSWRRGSGFGAQVTVTLEDVVLNGAPGSVTLSGTFSDTVGRAPRLLDNLGVLASVTPPLSGVLEKLLDGCGAQMTEPFLRASARSLADALPPVLEDLELAASAGQDGVLLALPPGLTRLPRALPLGARDARVVKAAVGLLQGALVWASVYQVLGGTPDGGPRVLKDLVVDGMTHVVDSDGGITTGAARVLDLPGISAGLNAHLLEPAAPLVDLRDVRAAWTTALVDVRAALMPQGPQGLLLRVDPLAVETLAPSVLMLTNALLDSLPSGATSVTLEDGVVVRLGAALDAPPTHDTLVAANASQPLSAVVQGNPDAVAAAGRDPVLVWRDRGASNVLLDAVVTVPPAAAQACDGAEDQRCGAGWACAPEELGMCASSLDACVSDAMCSVPGEGCQLPHRCRRALPPVVDWTALRARFAGPHAPGWAPWSWHMLQPLLGQDPVDATLVR